MPYCLKCRNTESKVAKNNAFLKLWGCNSENSKFIKQYGASGLLGSLGIKALLSKIHLVSPL